MIHSVTLAGPLYFHWGDPSGNEILLRLGGYIQPNGHSHFDDLSTGTEAHINEAFIKQTRDWYSKSKIDLAGAGFYVSSNPLDSRSYGNDLLIIEIEADESFTASNASRIKQMADRALESGDLSNLPLMTQYSGTSSVISRSPVGHDPRIAVRPPSALDVDRVWENISSEKSISAVVGFLGNMVAAMQTKLTRSSEIFFNRLLFDHGYSYFSKIFNAGPFPKEFVSDLTNASMERILNSYQTVLPNDPRTTTLFEGWIDCMVSNQIEIHSSSLLAIVKRAIPRISSTQINQLAPLLVKPLSNALFNPSSYLDVFMQFYDATAPYLSDENKKLLLGVIRDKADKIYSSSSNSQIQSFFRNHFSSEDIYESLAPVFHKSLKSVVKGIESNIDSEDLIANYLEKTQRLFSMTGYENTSVLKNILNESFSIPELFEISVYGALDLISKIRDPEARSILNLYLNDKLSARDPSLPLFADFFSILLKSGMTADQFSDLVRNWLKNHPALLGPILKGLHSRMTKTSSQPIRWSALIEEAKSAQLDLIPLEQEIHSVYTEEKLNTDYRPFASTVKGSLENIQGSRDYSRISRMFALADPILISEDLRLFNAKRPFERLNENYILLHEEFTQPAWENFLTAWDYFTFSQFKPELAKVIAKTDAILVATYVDGSRQSVNPERDQWDRNKFVTIVTKEQWDQLKLEQLKDTLDRFFHIKKNNNLFELTFKTFSGPTGIMENIVREVNQIQDPILRAAKILYLVPKYHPYEFGNGRLSRLWASIELLKSGHSMPVGLPTNDFFLTEKQMVLEVRRCIKVGEFWESMLRDSARDGIRIDDFFQTRFRGSALEGLMHISPTDPNELEIYVDWLEKQTTPPQWAKAFLSEVEDEIYKIRQTKGAVTHTSEIERYLALGNRWKQFRENHRDQIGFKHIAKNCADLLVGN